MIPLTDFSYNCVLNCQQRDPRLAGCATDLTFHNTTKDKRSVMGVVILYQDVAIRTWKLFNPI